MKKWLVSILLIILCSFAKVASGQIYTQTFIDKCTGETKVATTTYVNGNAVVSFYGQIKIFTPTQVTNGELQAWLQATYNSYNILACPTNPVVSQAITNQVSQAAAQAASQAASSAASAAASSAA